MSLRSSAALVAAVTAAIAGTGSAAAAVFVRTDTFGTKGSAPGALSYPSGIAVGADGTVFVSDTLNGRVQSFDPNGTLLGVIGAPGRQDGGFMAPHGIAVARDGSVWVADNGRDRIQHFGAAGGLLNAFGSSCLAGAQFQGACEGGFLGPEGLAPAGDGSLYVADIRNNRVQRVGADGAFRAVSSADFRLPEDVAVARDGSVLVTDTGNDRLRRLTPDLGKIRDTIVLPNGWRQPVGMTVAPDGCAYFLDWNLGRVGIVTDAGFAGIAVSRGVLSQPQAVAAAPDGSLYVADSEHNRVVRFDDPTPRAAGNEAMPGDSAAPALSAFSVSARFRSAAAARGCVAAVGHPAQIRYRLSRRALVTLTVRRNGRTVGRFVQDAGRGQSTRSWAGTIGATQLAAGRYVLEARARNAAGYSRTLTDAFTVTGSGPRAAAAAAASGTYAGWIPVAGKNNDVPIVVTTNRAGTRAQSVVLAARPRCPDGRQVAFHRRLAVRAGGPSASVLVPSRNSGGRLAATLRAAGVNESYVFTYRGSMTGSFRRTGARGTMRVTVDIADRATGAAVMTCTTPRMRWVAHRGRGRFYGGISSQGEPVYLSLTADRRMVWDVGVEWHADCTPSGFADRPDWVTEFRVSGGRFGDVFHHNDPLRNHLDFRLRGRLTRGEASGTVRIVLTARTGEVCRTAAVSWRLRSG